MKALSIETTFSFQCKRCAISEIENKYIGGMFESLEMNLGKSDEKINLIFKDRNEPTPEKLLGTKNSNITYKIRTTIQSLPMKQISESTIKKYEHRFKNEVFNRLSNIKKDIGEIKIKTQISFLSDSITLR